MLDDIGVIEEGKNIALLLGDEIKYYRRLGRGYHEIVTCNGDDSVLRRVWDNDAAYKPYRFVDINKPESKNEVMSDVNYVYEDDTFLLMSGKETRTYKKYSLGYLVLAGYPERIKDHVWANVEMYPPDSLHIHEEKKEEGPVAGAEGSDVHDQVVEFLRLLRESHSMMSSIFTKGSCWNLVGILSYLWGGEAYTNEDHFIIKINDRFYDIDGQVFDVFGQYIKFEDVYSAPSRALQIAEMSRSEFPLIEGDKPSQLESDRMHSLKSKAKNWDCLFSEVAKCCGAYDKEGEWVPIEMDASKLQGLDAYVKIGIKTLEKMGSNS